MMLAPAAPPSITITIPALSVPCRSTAVASNTAAQINAFPIEALWIFFIGVSPFTIQLERVLRSVVEEDNSLRNSG
jgi:hypothetical protein